MPGLDESHVRGEAKTQGCLVGSECEQLGR